MKKSNIPPRVIVGEEEDLLIPAIARAQSGKDSFYGSRIIPHVSSYVLIPMKKTNSGVLMVGNTLIVAKVDSPEFQTISPVISYLYINSYFRNRNIRHYPQIELLDKQRYQKYRKEDFTKKLQLYEELIQKIKDESTTVAEGIAQQQQEVLLNEENLTKLKAQREKDYIKCVNTGYYESGVFHKIYSKEDCLEQLIEQDDLIAQTQKKSEVLASSLKVDEKKLDNYQTYLKFYTNQKALTQEESGYISYEFATFNPPDEIKVALTLQDSPLALADYLELMIHEYLHYATFDESGKTLTSNFFMEGLTEYFARNIVKENLGVETNIGYPANIRIIGQMTKRIAERDIADVYFANDQAGLEELLDRVYQDGFYKDNIITLETLQYSSDKDQIIKLANEVLENIGGAPLTQDDIKTTYSTFE